MTSPYLNGPPGSARAFLVERYVSISAAQGLAASTARAARLCAEHPTDAPVRYLYSAYLPSEDTCFCLFLAPSAGAVQILNEQARFPLDRITDATLLFYPEQGPRLDDRDQHPSGPKPPTTSPAS